MIPNGSRFIEFSNELMSYVDQSRTQIDDELLSELRQSTAQFGEDAIMQIPDAQGTFMTLITRLIGAKTALEIGTFTGHSSICIARGLPEDGKLVCLDLSREWTDVAQQFWAKAGLRDRIELRLGDALETLAGINDLQFDLVHIDADKTQYDSYFEAALPMVRSGGLFVFDNMLRAGRVVDADPDPGTAALIKLNEKLSRDSRVETVLLTIGDGLQFCRKK